MDDSIVKILFLVGAVSLAVIVLSYGIVTFNQTRAQGNETAANASEALATFSDPEKQAYDGASIIGSEVLKAAQEALVKEGYGVLVITRTDLGASTAAEAIDMVSGKYYSTTSKTNTLVSYLTTSAVDAVAGAGTSFMTAAVETDFNQSVAYKGYIRRDADGMITLIAFVQQ